MSACISRHGEYGSHTYGEGAERFVCQRCAVLDEDAMLAALATAEAEVEKRWAAIGCRGCHAGSCRGHLAPEASAINGHALIAAETERDALSARLQAVRDAAGSLLAALDEQQWYPAGAHRGEDDISQNRLVFGVNYARQRFVLGTPGDERREWPKVHPKATRERATFPLDVPPPNPHLAARSCCGDSHFGDGCDPEARAEYESGTPGGEKPQPSEPESMVWETRGSASLLIVDRIVAWVNANGGEARYVPNGEDTPIGWSGYPRIAIRTAYGWAHAKPGDRIVKGDKWFDFIQTKPGMLPDEVRLREFTVSPVESSGSAE